MRRRAAGQGGSQTTAPDEWYGRSWCCECQYSNVGTDRCYFCGSRAPRDVVYDDVAVSPVEPDAAAGEG